MATYQTLMTGGRRWVKGREVLVGDVVRASDWYQFNGKGKWYQVGEATARSRPRVRPGDKYVRETRHRRR